jgi:drug/metabolite transporter (DMT)-like permease
VIKITLAKFITLGFLLLNIGLVSAAQILLKFGTEKFGSIVGNNNTLVALIKIATNPYILAGTSCYVLSLVLWIYILTRAQISVAYPVMSLSYITVMGLSIMFFKEAINLTQWTGALFIVIGTSLIFLFK